jgi:hypothetical protein
MRKDRFTKTGSGRKHRESTPKKTQKELYAFSFIYTGGVGNTTGGKFLNNHNWVEYWDDVAQV